MVFSLGHLVIFGEKPENCAIRKKLASEKTLITSAVLRLKQRFCF